MYQAQHRIDSNNHAVIDIIDDAAQPVPGWPHHTLSPQIKDLTSHEAEKLIKSLRKAIDAADAHNRSATFRQTRWP